MRTKEDLDAQYADDLRELQGECDHVIDHLMAGTYGSDCYGDCFKCEAQIHFGIDLARDPEKAVSMLYLRWHRMNSDENFKVPWQWFDHLFSNAEIEQWHNNGLKWSYRNAEAREIKAMISGLPYSTWQKELAMGPIKEELKHD